MQILKILTLPQFYSNWNVPAFTSCNSGKLRKQKSRQLAAFVGTLQE